MISETKSHCRGRGPGPWPGLVASTCLFQIWRGCLFEMDALEIKPQVRHLHYKKVKSMWGLMLHNVLSSSLIGIMFCCKKYLNVFWHIVLLRSQNKEGENKHPKPSMLPSRLVWVQFSGARMRSILRACVDSRPWGTHPALHLWPQCLTLGGCSDLGESHPWVEQFCLHRDFPTHLFSSFIPLHSP